MLPPSERAHAEYDVDRRCENCDSVIPRARQENALYMGRYPKYCDDVCENRAACRRYYARRGKGLRAIKKRLNAARRARKKKK